MSKGIKTLALVFIFIMLFIMVYHFFGSSSPANGATASQNEEAPFWVSLLVSWIPMIAILVFYVLFLQIFKKIHKTGERIAAALEKISSNQKKAQLNESNILI